MGPAFMAPPRHEGPSPGWLAFPFIVVAARPSEKVLFVEQSSVGRNFHPISILRRHLFKIDSHQDKEQQAPAIKPRRRRWRGIAEKTVPVVSNRKDAQARDDVNPEMLPKRFVSD